MRAYETGYRVAWLEIEGGVASSVQASERGLFPGDEKARIEWDRGYLDCVCAYRLGHSVEEMIRHGFFEPSASELAVVVMALLDGTWRRKIRPDPRNLTCRPGAR